MMIRIALAGLGKIARDQHLPVIARHPDYSLAATVSRHAGLDGVPRFATMDELVGSGLAVDAVALCTPPQVRGAYARAAIAAGLGVLLEKPPAASLSEFEDLRSLAAAAGVPLFATWHSRFAPMVADARTWAAGRIITGGRIIWREDVRQWHPGQQWLWEAGGMGVFDPGINALSILTAILPAPPFVEAASLDRPENAQTPIAARLKLRSGAALIDVDFDFREAGTQIWTIALEAQDGGRLELRDGGSVLVIDGQAPRRQPDAEYRGIYDRFAELVRTGESDADAAPLRLVADAMLLAETRLVEAFVE